MTLIHKQCRGPQNTENEIACLHAFELCGGTPNALFKMKLLHLVIVHWKLAFVTMPRHPTRVAMHGCHTPNVCCDSVAATWCGFCWRVSGLTWNVLESVVVLMRCQQCCFGSTTWFNFQRSFHFFGTSAAVASSRDRERENGLGLAAKLTLWMESMPQQGLASTG